MRRDCGNVKRNKATARITATIIRLGELMRVRTGTRLLVNILLFNEGYILHLTTKTGKKQFLVNLNIFHTILVTICDGSCLNVMISSIDEGVDTLYIVLTIALRPYAVSRHIQVTKAIFVIQYANIFFGHVKLNFSHCNACYLCSYNIFWTCLRNLFFVLMTFSCTFCQKSKLFFYHESYAVKL